MLEWFLIAACVVLVLLPPKYDPAIRLKEWSARKQETNDEQG